MRRSTPRKKKMNLHKQKTDKKTKAKTECFVSCISRVSKCYQLARVRLSKHCTSHKTKGCSNKAHQNEVLISGKFGNVYIYNYCIYTYTCPCIIYTVGTTYLRRLILYTQQVYRTTCSILYIHLYIWKHMFYCVYMHV